MSLDSSHLGQIHSGLDEGITKKIQLLNDKSTNECAQLPAPDFIIMSRVATDQPRGINCCARSTPKNSVESQRASRLSNSAFRAHGA